MDVRSSLLLLFLFAPSTVFFNLHPPISLPTPPIPTSAAPVHPSSPRSPDSPGYRELSLYSGQSFGYPLVMSSLKVSASSSLAFASHVTGTPSARLPSTGNARSQTPRPLLQRHLTARVNTPMVPASRSAPKSSLLTTTGDANPSSYGWRRHCLLERHANPRYPPNQSHLRFRSRPHHSPRRDPLHQNRRLVLPFLRDGPPLAIPTWTPF